MSNDEGENLEDIEFLAVANITYSPQVENREKSVEITSSRSKV
jgi:hypothetical protein